MEAEGFDALSIPLGGIWRSQGWKNGSAQLPATNRARFNRMRLKPLCHALMYPQ